MRVVSSLTYHRSILPQELVDHIIAYLQDDKKALFSTSLVARAWVSCSQRFLHRCISISTRPAFNLSEKLDPNRYTSPDLARFVHSLTVHLGWVHSVFDMEVWGVVSRLTEIRHLSLVCSHMGSPPEPKNIYTPVFCHVSSLRLSSSLFKGPEIFLSFISLFPTVVELFMYGVECKSPDSGLLGPDNPLVFLPDVPGSQLRRIEVDPEGDEDLIRFLAQWFSALPTDVFNGVELRCQGLLYPELISVLFCGIGPSLAHLSIDLSDFASIEEIGTCLI